MITLLPVLASRSLSSYSNSRSILGREVLTQKVYQLRQRMGELEEKTHQIEQNQMDMKKVTLLIEQDQEEVEKQNEVIGKRQDQLKQNLIQVRRNHLYIRAHCLMVNPSLQWLLQRSFQIQEEQKQLQIRCNKMDQTKLEIEGYAGRIRQRLPLIKQDLQGARQKENFINEHALAIRKEHQTMYTLVQLIEVQRDEIRQNLPNFQEKLSSNVLPGRSENNFKKRQISETLSAGWLKRIYDFCLRIIALVCKKLAEFNQWVQKEEFSIHFSAMTHQAFIASQIALGWLTSKKG